jgi:hypothetical protein
MEDKTKIYINFSILAALFIISIFFWYRVAHPDKNVQGYGLLMLILGIVLVVLAFNSFKVSKKIEQYKTTNLVIFIITIVYLIISVLAFFASRLVLVD